MTYPGLAPGSPLLEPTLATHPEGYQELQRRLGGEPCDGRGTASDVHTSLNCGDVELGVGTNPDWFG